MAELFPPGSIYYYLLGKIKEKNKADIIQNDFLKECLGRVGTRFGWFPHNMCYDVINDLVQYGFLERINQRYLKIIINPETEKKIKKIKKE